MPSEHVETLDACAKLVASYLNADLLDMGPTAGAEEAIAESACSLVEEIHAAINQAVQTEREACAKVCDDFLTWDGKQLARKIRARGK